jgi:P-type E1-E2 ATPase
MITGDNKIAAQAVANQLAIDEVYADSLPADKLHILSKLKPRPVVFVGDGVNDAPVLTSASVGIALGARGSTAASESADMVIMLNDISRVAVAVEIAQKTFKIASQSILIGIGLSIALMAVFATGKSFTSGSS